MIRFAKTVMFAFLSHKASMGRDDAISSSSKMEGSASAWESFNRELMQVLELTSRFKCTCVKPCFGRKMQLIKILGNTPATFDFSSPIRDNDMCETVMMPHELKSFMPDNQMRITLSRREASKGISASYTFIMLLADVANTFGLFFGVSVMALYEVLEKRFLEDKSLHPGDPPRKFQ